MHSVLRPRQKSSNKTQPVPTFTKHNLDTIINQIEFLSEIIETNDCDQERKATVQGGLDKLKKIYTEIQGERKKQTSISKFFTKKSE